MQRQRQHLPQILGPSVHPCGGQHQGGQRRRPQHVRGHSPRHRVGLSTRGPEQSQPRQYPACLNTLGHPVPRRSQSGRPQRSRQLFICIYGARMILGLQKIPHNT